MMSIIFLSGIVTATNFDIKTINNCETSIMVGVVDQVVPMDVLVQVNDTSNTEYNLIDCVEVAQDYWKCNCINGTSKIVLNTTVKADYNITLMYAAYETEPKLTYEYVNINTKCNIFCKLKKLLYYKLW
jgi:hypothetical protein